MGVDLGEVNANLLSFHTALLFIFMHQTILIISDTLRIKSVAGCCSPTGNRTHTAD